MPNRVHVNGLPGRVVVGVGFVCGGSVSGKPALQAESFTALELSERPLLAVRRVNKLIRAKRV